MQTNPHIPILAITMGDPLGIGPEIIVKSLLNSSVRRGAKFLLIGSEAIFHKLPGFEKIRSFNNITFVDTGTSGRLTPKNSGEYALEALRTAVSLIKSGKAQALVTAPISKERVKACGFKFLGHTEYLCAEFGAKHHAMMLFHPRLRVVLSTIHVPLKDVPKLLTKELIKEKLTITADALKKTFRIRKPRIAVCGLNPHAGENGLIGREEKSVIIPAIKAFQAVRKDVVVSGPHASDTVFFEALQGKFDAVLCQYHDQGLIPLKTTDFYHGVNMTLGLPLIRTSPDHGTAFAIAGKGLANPESLMYAITAAKDLLNA